VDGRQAAESVGEVMEANLRGHCERLRVESGVSKRLRRPGVRDGDSRHDIFTVPRSFLEALLQEQQLPRLRLLPPYREHLSQAFARFFMRVGLPQPVTPSW
jgi:hypothetical protein